MNITYTEDYESISSQGVVFYNDCDETVMELYKDGKLISSVYITDFCESHNMTYDDFTEDKCKVYDMFIDSLLVTVE